MTIAPIPTSTRSLMVHPCTMALCPILTSFPIVVGAVWKVQWMTALSWIFTLLPIRMLFTSPRTTALNHTLQSSPVTTSPQWWHSAPENNVHRNRVLSFNRQQQSHEFLFSHKGEDSRFGCFITFLSDKYHLPGSGQKFQNDLPGFNGNITALQSVLYTFLQTDIKTAYTHITNAVNLINVFNRIHIHTDENTAFITQRLNRQVVDDPPSTYRCPLI